jgi:hypothetical protein
MADQQEPKARYPKADGLPEGAEHGYLGDVEVYDPADPDKKGKVTHQVADAVAEGYTPEAVTGTTGTIAADDTPAKASKSK